MDKCDSGRVKASLLGVSKDLLEEEEKPAAEEASATSFSSSPGTSFERSMNMPN